MDGFFFLFFSPFLSFFSFEILARGKKDFACFMGTIMKRTLCRGVFVIVDFSPASLPKFFFFFFFLYVKERNAERNKGKGKKKKKKRIKIDKGFGWISDTYVP